MPGRGRCPTQGCICQISLGGSKFWLLKSTTVLMHRYIESRPPCVFNSSRGVRNFRGGVQPPNPSCQIQPWSYLREVHRLQSLAGYCRWPRDAEIPDSVRCIVVPLCTASGLNDCIVLAARNARECPTTPRRTVCNVSIAAFVAAERERY